VPAGLANAAWGPAVTLSDAGANAVSPRLAVSPGGAAVAAWSLQFTGPLAVQAAVRPAGADWGRPETLAIAASQDESQGPPQVAIDGAGNAVAAWPARVGTDFGCTGARSAACAPRHGPPAARGAHPRRSWTR
jgi:hypothetical protein